MQNPPPGQPGFGSSYGAPASDDASAKASTGLDANLAAALSYIGIIGLIFFFLEKENRFVRFHAMQSILCHVLWLVVIFVLIIVNIILALVFAAAAAAAGDAGGAIGLVVSLVSVLVWTIFPLAFIGLLVICAVKAYQRNIFKLPIIGNMAEKFANK
jgi:uncharacterized membrane protein